MQEPGRRSGSSGIADLPPELWDHITNYLPTAASVASLGRTNKGLHTYVEKDGWKTFARARFPSLCPVHSPRYSDTVRTLSTLSKAWDRLAFVAQNVRVEGDIRSFPGNQTVARWETPTGQTIGFAPQLDILEEVGPRWQDRRETLAFSAGAGVCIRQTDKTQGAEKQRWTTYRPASVSEGRDDVTVLHLLQPIATDQGSEQRLIAGTAGGDLRLITLPGVESDKTDVEISSLDTGGLPVGSGSLLRQADQPSLLATSLGNTKVALYAPESGTAPLSQIDIPPPSHVNGNRFRTHRIWTTSILSPTSLAIGTGLSHEPIQVNPITPTGISKTPTFTYELPGHSSERLDSPATEARHGVSIYTIVPLPDTQVQGQLFLSGAYDGLIRLHDQRAPTPSAAVVRVYEDDTDDSSVYSLLPRGREKLLAGTSQHKLLKVFDLRLGAKCYSYPEPTIPDADGKAEEEEGEGEEECAARQRQRQRGGDHNIFLHDHASAATPPFRGSGPRREMARVSHPHSSPSSRGPHASRSSVYSLASASADSPRVYAGVEGGVISLAFGGILDARPDPAHFGSWTRTRHRRQVEMTVPAGAIMSVAMYARGGEEEVRLKVQQDIGKMRVREVDGGGGRGRALDERWRDAADGS